MNVSESLQAPVILFRRYVLRPSKWLFTPVALAYVAYIFWRSHEAAWELASHAYFPLILLSWVSLAIAHFLSPLGAWLILRALGSPARYPNLLATHLLRLPARYLPGGVWHTVGRAADIRRMGVETRSVVALVVLENSYAIAWSFILGAALLLAAGEQRPMLHMMLAGVLGALLLALLLVPRIYRLATSTSDRAPGLSSIAECSASFIAIWTFYAVGFAAYYFSLFQSPDFHSATMVAGAYLFSWAVGLVAFFAPQGIGVFESLNAYMLASSNLAAGVLVAFGFRICMLTVDLMLWVAARILCSWFAQNEHKSG